MKTLNPPTGLVSLRREMDRLFDSLWPSDIDEMPALGEWLPMMDLWETKEGFILKAEVPGIEPKDIHITLMDQVLTIRGEKKKEIEEKDQKFYRMERLYGSFARSIHLPVPVDPKKVMATFKNGLLTVLFTKVTVGNGLTIPIETR